jgi:hypothetical protein
MTRNHYEVSEDYSQAEKLREILNNVMRIETDLRSIEHNMIALRDGMSELLTKLRKRDGGDQQN